MWLKSESTVRPERVERNGQFVYVRENIVEEQRQSEGEELTMYVYDENVFTADEFAAYEKEEQNKANIDYIAMMSDIEIPEEV